MRAVMPRSISLCNRFRRKAVYDLLRTREQITYETFKTEVSAFSGVTVLQKQGERWATPSLEN